jgi:hypothetical protein
MERRALAKPNAAARSKRALGEGRLNSKVDQIAQLKVEQLADLSPHHVAKPTLHTWVGQFTREGVKRHAYSDGWDWLCRAGLRSMSG